MDLARTLLNIRGPSALLSRGSHFQTRVERTRKLLLEILAVYDIAQVVIVTVLRSTRVHGQ